VVLVVVVVVVVVVVAPYLILELGVLDITSLEEVTVNVAIFLG